MPTGVACLVHSPDTPSRVDGALSSNLDSDRSEGRSGGGTRTVTLSHVAFLLSVLVRTNVKGSSRKVFRKEKTCFVYNSKDNMRFFDSYFTYFGEGFQGFVRTSWKDLYAPHRKLGVEQGFAFRKKHRVGSVGREQLLNPSTEFSPSGARGPVILDVRVGYGYPTVVTYVEINLVVPLLDPSCYLSTHERS